MTAPPPSLSVQQLTAQLEELLAIYLRDTAEPKRDPWRPTIARGRFGDQMATHLPTLLATIRRLQAACDAKQAVIDAVTELHHDTDDPGVYYQTLCAECRRNYPCPTVRALASPDTAQEA